MDEYLGQSFDYVVTVCDEARQSCPVFPGVHESLHWGYEDPAAAEGTVGALRRDPFAMLPFCPGTLTEPVGGGSVTVYGPTISPIAGGMSPRAR